MADILVGIVLLMMIGGAAGYIVKEKKKGTKCIGCPAAGACAQKCGCVSKETTK